MSTQDAQSTHFGRSNRVVSLPCGHLVHLEDEESLLAVSGPVMDHQSTCRVPRSPTFAAWFATELPHSTGMGIEAARPRGPAPVLGEAKTA